MNQDKNEAAQDFMKEVVDDLGYTPKGDKNNRSARSGGPKTGPGFLIPTGIVILLLVAIIAFFFTDKTGDYKEDLMAIQSGLQRLEEKMARLDGLEKRVARLEAEAKKLVKSVNAITARNVKTDKKKASLSRKKSSPTKKRYHTVRAGESLYAISKKYGISIDKLCKLNKISPKKPLQKGQRLLVGG
ncbi:MAG: LysM peptidoglycan-binding domain-containing protein [Deltaproteobacteria bacterium]|nr:LysM peptidoglycan-binding domain-containing protein [Deltaproteobacteria bacterium]